MARAVMFLGTGSDVGKSLLVAAIGRALTRRGLAVRPFKSQNMSNNAAVTADGGEIGRAQAVQAWACGVAPSVHMNPVLLKPQTDIGAQIVVQGQVWREAEARQYFSLKSLLLPKVLESFEIVGRGADLVLVEGAGSPAEVNLRAGDIANLGFARAAGVPAILVGDIDRGGVIASIVGTKVLLLPEEERWIRGYLINRFRGDVSLFDGGLRIIEERTGWRGLGVVPHLAAAARLPPEDAVVLERGTVEGREARLVVAVPMLSRIANFDDLDPLLLEPAVEVRMIPPGKPLPADATVVIIPGTKSTRGDLAFFRAQGWDVDLAAHVRRGGRVVGLCGGYQLLGHTLSDPDGVDGMAGTSRGLGLLDTDTSFVGEKVLRNVAGRAVETGEAIEGYEIHVGRTTRRVGTAPVFIVEGEEEGARSRDGQVWGTYVHGIFRSDAFRQRWLRGAGAPVAELGYGARVDAALDELAEAMERHVALDALLEIAAEPQPEIAAG